MSSVFTLESVKEFMILNGGKVKNHELVTHFKNFLNDPRQKAHMRDKFKDFVNTLATIKVDEQGEKILMLKKKYRPDSGVAPPMNPGTSSNSVRASSEPPGREDVSRLSAEGGSLEGKSRYGQDGAMSTPDTQLSSSAASSASLSVSAGSSVNDTTSLGSAMSTLSMSSGALDEDTDMSVMSVKERAKHLNKMESESELLQTSVSPLGLTRKRDKRSKDDGEHSESSGCGYVVMEPIEKEWLVVSSAAEYHPMHQLLSKHPELARVKDFTSTALHWAAKNGRAEVIKMLIGKPGVNINQRTGYTPLHLAALQGHETIIELLVKGFKADPNIRDYSGKKAKQYLRNSASSRTQPCRVNLDRSLSMPSDILEPQKGAPMQGAPPCRVRLGAGSELLVSSRHGHSSNDKGGDGSSFMRNTSGRRSNRAKAISSLIQASTSGMKQAVLRSTWGSVEDVHDDGTGRLTPSPRHSAEPSPISHRRGLYHGKDRDMMPPPAGGSRFSKRQAHSVSKESLFTEDKRLSQLRQVPRSESEPNLGEATLSSKTTIV